MSEETVQIFINDKEISAPKGAMIIEVADQNDIDIPRFCYHKKLSVAANCRMCMVEVEKAPKPLPACATPVADGMKVYTKSSLALDAQQGTMEFLLINHPLDCPVCDQGGECELQDVAMGYGTDVSRYMERKRVVPDKELGPLVSTDMTRCIHCTRCVRFGAEIAGIRELGATGRGEFMEIGTYVERSLSSELSGNVIDVCPVGALNAKPSRMHARSWEMVQTASVAPHDSVGSNIYVHTLRNKAMRVVPRENDAINETWISDRDRFSYEGLYSGDRAMQPMLKGEREWQVQDWDAGLSQVAEKLKGYKAEQVGVLAAPHSTLEEMYLLQKIFRKLGVQNIDHRTRQQDFTDQNSMPLFPYLGQTIDELENNNAIFLIGSDIRVEQPMLAHRMRKASKAGCKISTLNAQDYDFLFANQYTWNYAPQKWVNMLAEVAKHADHNAIQNLAEPIKNLINEASTSDQSQSIYELLRNSENSSVLIGAIADCHPQASALRALANVIADVTGSKFGIIAQAGNTAGAWLSGVVPHRLTAGQQNTNAGLNAADMLVDTRKAYILFNLEPEFDFAHAPMAINAMQNADYVIMFTPYVTERMQAYADVILPIATFAETEGTYVNAEGRWQSVAKSISAPNEARPGWRVLRVLANKLGFEDVQYQTCQEISDELKAQFASDIKFDGHLTDLSCVNLKLDGDGLFRVSSTPIYAIDNVVRRANSLQDTVYEVQPYIAMCEQQAQDLDVLNQAKVRVVQGNKEVTLPLQISQAIPMQCVWIQKSALQSDLLGVAIAPVEIQRLAYV